ncbi:MAG: transcriptional regulator, TetR family [Frankiales bacterium]|jgi:AcrR family transcriptional regulator|nr:transcriptional regulator, TetR family [Frankiales bacterium]
MYVTSRDERRHRSETAILAAARELFAEVGFERATIRAVAAQANVDPALVMQHFGNKEALFAAATQWPGEHQRILDATPDSLAAAALDDLLAHFEEADDRGGAVALMRSCLTHPTAMQVMRDQVMCERQAAVAGKLTGEDAELRAGLFAACMVGLGMARYLIRLEPVASASQEDLHRLMEPVLKALTE